MTNRLRLTTKDVNRIVGMADQVQSLAKSREQTALAKKWGSDLSEQVAGTVREEY